MNCLGTKDLKLFESECPCVFVPLYIDLFVPFFLYLLPCFLAFFLSFFFFFFFFFFFIRSFLFFIFIFIFFSWWESLGTTWNGVMDAQYPFASRDDIWRVFQELRDVQTTQLEQSERIGQLERRRDEDARLRSVWGPLSPFPTSVGMTLPSSIGGMVQTGMWLA